MPLVPPFCNTLPIVQFLQCSSEFTIRIAMSPFALKMTKILALVFHFFSEFLASFFSSSKCLLFSKKNYHMQDIFFIFRVLKGGHCNPNK
jgi:hypothetical protein